jgi:hypothetical protein
MMSVVLFRLSMMDSLHAYMLSYLFLTTESLTFMAGAVSFPLWDSCSRKGVASSFFRVAAQDDYVPGIIDGLP